MAIYHLSVKTVSRSTGRSATAAAAYRSGARIVDRREGVIHDYRRRSGVLSTMIVAPAGAAWARDREALWNRAELAENRRNSTVAREYELALPAELDAVGREALVTRFAEHLVERYGIAADIAIHAPSREGDARNHHAHVLTTTRAVGPDGLGAKTRVLDTATTGAAEIERLRASWAEMTNAALAACGLDERVDHRSLAAQGVEGPATKHLGPALTAVERWHRRDAWRVAADYVPRTEKARANSEIFSAREEYEQAQEDLANALKKERDDRNTAPPVRGDDHRAPPSGLEGRHLRVVPASGVDARPSQQKADRLLHDAAHGDVGARQRTGDRGLQPVPAATVSVSPRPPRAPGRPKPMPSWSSRKRWDQRKSAADRQVVAGRNDLVPVAPPVTAPRPAAERYAPATVFSRKAQRPPAAPVATPPTTSAVAPPVAARPAAKAWSPLDETSPERRTLMGSILDMTMELERRSTYAAAIQPVLDAAWKALGDIAPRFKAWLDAILPRQKDPDARAEITEVSSWRTPFKQLRSQFEREGRLPRSPGPRSPQKPGRGGREL